MAKWRLAKSLEKLRTQINAAYPDRSKASDGTIGDTAHSARVSDHNPNAAGVVCAMDITHDPVGGVNAHDLAAALVRGQDERVKYIIWNKQMVSSYPARGKPAWAWRLYTGTNPHQKHIHISVQDDKALYDSIEEWDIGEIPEEPVAVSTEITKTTVIETPESTTVLEEKSELTIPPQVKEIAGTGLSSIGNKLAGGSIGGGALATIGAFLEKAWPVLIFASVLIILGIAVWMLIYHHRHTEKQIQAQIASDPDRTDIAFVPKAKTVKRKIERVPS